MRKLLALAGLAGGLASAQYDVNQPLNWGERFRSALSVSGDALRPISSYPKGGLDQPGIAKGAAGRVESAFGALGLKESKLYQPEVFWKPCGPYPGLYKVEFSYMASAMRRMNYVPVAQKVNETENLTVWNDASKVRPQVVTVVNAACGESETVLVTAFQVGNAKKHIAYLGELSAQQLQPKTQKVVNTSVQLRSPTGPSVPGRDGFILVQLFNTSSKDVEVTLKVDVRDASGQIINSYSQGGIAVKANAPKQTEVEFLGVGARDALITIESVK